MSDEFGHVGQIIPGFGCIDSWGVGPFVITAENGKAYRFEDSDRFGPALVKENGDPLKNPWPRERDPFWRAHRIWVRQGRRTDADGVTCVWDEPKATTFYDRLMATEPTIEEVDAAKAGLTRIADEFKDGPLAKAIRTLLASHASLEERVKEAKRLMEPFAEAAENLDDTNDFDDDELWEHAAAIGLHVRDLRALAAFVNEKET